MIRPEYLGRNVEHFFFDLQRFTRIPQSLDELCEIIESCQRFRVLQPFLCFETFDLKLEELTRFPIVSFFVELEPEVAGPGRGVRMVDTELGRDPPTKLDQKSRFVVEFPGLDHLRQDLLNSRPIRIHDLLGRSLSLLDGFLRYLPPNRTRQPHQHTKHQERVFP